MSEPIDDKTFEEYLSRESQLSKRYRALEADTVPAQLDVRILAQAREAVAAKPASSRTKPAWMRWTPPLALAASMVLVISIVIQSGTQHEVTTRDVAATMSRSAPAPQEAAADSNSLEKQESKAVSADLQPLSAMVPEPSVAGTASEAPQKARKRVDAAPGQDLAIGELQQIATPPPQVPMISVPSAAPEARGADLAPEAPPPPVKVEVPPPLPVSAVATTANVRSGELRRQEAIAAAERDDLAEIVVTGTQRPASRAGQGAGPRGTVTSQVAGSREVSEEELLRQALQSDPQRWLEHIRQLRRENKGREADREWRSFIATHPNYTVDEKDVARARQ